MKRVTQQSKGRKTAGIDRERALTPPGASSHGGRHRPANPTLESQARQTGLHPEEQWGSDAQLGGSTGLGNNRVRLSGGTAWRTDFRRRTTGRAPRTAMEIATVRRATQNLPA
ncbi:hypothetical protein [Streptomyces sp. NPDC051577]|uniref:hypothetical protein n=1 Tax=Streptomyces sp. NPDC051577 TaxID=3155166 RepID=UPI00344A135D